MEVIKKTKKTFIGQEKTTNCNGKMAKGEVLPPTMGNVRKARMRRGQMPARKERLG